MKFFQPTNRIYRVIIPNSKLYCSNDDEKRSKYGDRLLFCARLHFEDALAIDFPNEHDKCVEVIDLACYKMNKHANVFEYVKYVKDLPEALRPVPRLTAQVAQAIREAMSGQPKQVIQAAIRRAERDVCFLLKLRLQLNEYFMTEERVWTCIFATLEAGLRAISGEVSHTRLINGLTGMFSREMPYPLDPETANTVKWAIHNHVTTWDELKEDTLDEWLLGYFLDFGTKQLPGEAYDYKDGKLVPNVNAQNEKELRECFKDDTEFERFKAGEDYSKGLADIKDTEYNTHYKRMVTAMQELVDSGRVQKGESVYLETVPTPFLQWAPLIEGKWFDRHVAELAELGALIRAKGYKPQEANDDHPLAWPLFINDNGDEVDKDDMLRLRKLAGRSLKRFPGQTREIDGRPYISFEDYCSWHGRKVKDDLRSEVSEGFVTSSWNAWLDVGGEKGRLEGVRVTRLECYLGEHDYQVCQDGPGSQLERRSSLLNIMRKAGLPRAEREEAFWKEMVGHLLTKLYTFRLAVSAISHRYFDGEELLFSDLTRSLAELIKYTEELVATFNSEVTRNTEDAIDLEAFRQGAARAAVQQISYLVDMARAEALEAMGEDRAATEMVERHLEV